MYNVYDLTLLQITSSLIERFTESKQNKGDDFNIFSILDIERREVETHSKFIYELLNPKGSHYQNTLFADLFVERVLKLPDSGKIKEVKREDLTKNKRRIDFSINTENYLIGIEMKIDAGDQKEQLYDYHNELTRRVTNKKQKSILYYLTLDGVSPSNFSTKKDLVKNSIKCISFKQDILNWLETCIAQVALKPVIRELIQQYYLTIKKITNQDMELDMLIAEEIIKNKNNLLAAEGIYKGYDLAIKKIEKNLMERLIESIQNQSSWNPDRGSKVHDITSRAEDGWIWIPYKIGVLNTNKSKCIYAAITQHSQHNYLRLAVFVGLSSKPDKIALEIDESLKNKITKDLLDKLSIYSIKQNYDWGDFINGSLDSTFKLNGAANLTEWIGVTSSSKEVKATAKIIVDALNKVNTAVSPYI